MGGGGGVFAADCIARISSEILTLLTPGVPRKKRIPAASFFSLFLVIIAIIGIFLFVPMLPIIIIMIIILTAECVVL